MKKLKILLVTQDYPPPSGGIQTYTYNLEQNLKKAGHHVLLSNYDSRNTNTYKKLQLRDFFYTRSTYNSYYSIFKVMNPFNFLTLGGYRDFVYQNMLYRESRNIIKKFKPDLIHILNAKLYSSVYESKIPFIVTCHSEEIINTYPIKYSLSNAAKIDCVTNFTANMVLKIVPNRKKDVSITHIGVELEKYNSLQVKKKNQIITVCRLTKRKNVATVIKAISLLPEYILKEYKYVIVGEGEEKENLEKLVFDLKLTENVTFMGEVDEATKIKLLSESKIYIMCPIPFRGEKEGFGISYIEAQASGVPVIGSKIGGIIEAIGEGGLYVQNPTNQKKIAEKIELLINDKKKYNKLLRAIKGRISHFEMAMWFAKICRMYNEVIKVSVNEIPQIPRYYK
jgi:glycosyltransferase involved in cell wall biosynthesis